NAVRLLALLNSLSAWWHMVGVVVIVFVLAIVPNHHQSFSFVFTKTLNVSGFSGHNFSSPVFWFVFGIGLLMAQYTYTGYDASAHMSEETRKASRAAALGVVMSVVMSVIFGFILLVAVTFAVIAIAVLSWALMLPTLANGAIGYLVGTSIAVIGLYIAYGVPIYLRYRAGDSFQPGAWTLGKHYKWINPIAVVWIVFIVIL